MNSPAPPTRVYRFGRFQLDPENGILLRQGKVIRLPDQSIRVLCQLLQRPGEVVSRDALRQTIWPNGIFVEFDTNLNSVVKRLRSSLGDDADNPRFIETIRRQGYRFIAPVAEIVDTSQLQDLSSPVPKARQDVPGLQPSHFHSLAVLPFTNGTGPPDAEYLSEGISESIINLLSQFPDLRVVPRTSAFRYKGLDAELKTVARGLNVDMILTGTVVHLGERLIVQTELVDVANNAQLWGEQYNRKLEDIFDLQEELARRISESLRPRLTADEAKSLNRRPTENRTAYHLYLKAMYHANKWTAEGIQQGIAYSREAIAADPLFARAYAGLAYLYVLVSAFGRIPPLQAFPLARAATLRALEIDDTLATAHACLAYIMLAHDWDWTGAARESQHAIELAPNIPDGHYVRSQWCLVSGRSDEAITEATRALELDPLSLPNYGNLSLTYYMLGRYDSAIEQLQKALELDPSFHPARKLFALSYALTAKYGDAFAAVESVPMISGGATRTDINSQSVRGVICALSGRQAEARAILGELAKYSRPPDFLSALDCAYIHAFLGEKDQALDCCDQAFQGRAPTLFYIRLNPVYEILHTNPRFGDLLRRMGLPD